MSAPNLADITRATAILNHWKQNWLEQEWLGCSIDRWLEIKTWEDMLEWVDENESQHNSDCGFFIRYCRDIGLDTYGAGCGNYIAPGTYFSPELYTDPTVDGSSAALFGRGGVYAGGEWFDYDQMRVTEDVSHSFYSGSRPLHPWDGETNPVDPRQGRGQGKYSWAKSPRYDVPGHGIMPLEAGPLARRIAAGAPNPAEHMDSDPLFLDILGKIGPSAFVRQMARMHERTEVLPAVMTAQPDRPSGRSSQAGVSSSPARVSATEAPAARRRTDRHRTARSRTTR